MSLAQKKVTVTFTYKQAEALHHAAGDILSVGDASDAVFNNDKSRIEAAQRAWQKLLDAYLSVKRNHWEGER